MPDDAPEIAGSGSPDGAATGISPLLGVVAGPSTAEPSPADPPSPPGPELNASWNQKKYNIRTSASWSIGDLKRKLFELTDVEPKRQKFIGLVKGPKAPEDDVLLKSLTILKADGSFMMMGTPENSLAREQAMLEASDDIVNDLDAIYTAADAEAWLKDAGHRAKLAETAKKTTITLINPPLRPEKRLLVLDLDYTVYDCKSTASNITELMRPGLHAFLETLYPYYEFCVWSQTSWRWLEAKVTEMGMLTHSNYKIAFVLDRTSMFSIESSRGKHQVKALDIIWTHLKQFSAKNTVHIDDLARNFAMNPQSGLKIAAFKNGPSPASRADRELFKLTKYLLRIAHPSITDFSKLDHKKWNDFEGPFPPDFDEAGR